MKFLKELLLISVFLTLLHASSASQGKAATKAELLAYFSNLSGKGTISGQHNKEPNSDPTKWTHVAFDITGKYPGLWGGDFLFREDDRRNRQTMIDEAIREWNDGSVVALTWHVCPPNIGETCEWDDQGVLSHLNDNQWNDLVTDGGQLNNAWKARLDTIVPFFKQLDAAGVVAIWRPIHEMNEGWSWWGGRPGSNGSRKLYQLTYDYMTQYHNLHNLIWVWCVKDVDMGSVDQYWPGDDYVDIAGLDIWMNTFAKDEDYQTMRRVANGKPISLAEVGAVPPPDLLARQSEWIWFMVWAEYLKDPAFNTDDSVKDCYYSPRVLSRGDLDIGGGGEDATNLALNHPIKSSTQSGTNNGAEKAVDGDLSTKWTSDNTEEQWIYVDLGSTRSIREIKLYWDGSGYAKGYQIQASTDESFWVTIHEDYNGTGGVVNVRLNQDVNTRFVKIYVFTKGTTSAYSLQEIEIRA